jgi:hypothetical protein
MVITLSDIVNQSNASVVLRAVAGSVSLRDIAEPTG